MTHDPETEKGTDLFNFHEKLELALRIYTTTGPSYISQGPDVAPATRVQHQLLRQIKGDSDATAVLFYFLYGPFHHRLQNGDMAA